MAITPLPKTPNVDSSVSKSLWDWLIKLGVAVNQLISQTNVQNWQTPTLINSWVNYGAPYNNAGYYKDCNGIVHLKGQVKLGTVGSGLAIFVLPVGFRPESQEMHVTISYTTAYAISRCDIFATGEVVANSGGNVIWSLDGISFRAA